MSPAITQELFTAYVQGTASAADAATVRAWLTQPANQLLAQYWMGQHWEELAAQPAAPADAPDFEALLGQVHGRLSLGQSRRLPVAAPAWRRWAAAAAVAGTVLGGGSWWLYNQRPVAAPAQQIATAYGQTRTVQLPDGSSVVLNGHSTLRYPETWAAGKPREVWLDGEAYFSVQHQADNQRFLVHTKAGFNVEVLGTKFTVSRRRDQGRVVLLSGKVRVHFDNRQQPDVILKPGELVETREVQPAQPVVTTYRTVRTAPYASWKDAQLVLDETSIAELATRLQDTYGLEVVVATPELNQRRVTGTVPVRDLTVLLQSLEEIFHLQATRQGNRLTLTEKVK
ncbi:FecR family protein [Hymenobacter sp. BT559]|uniref:FecR family protein n=1 Tax=Hymenobacter sp. BT559 TaxID=2795729 RepID=UPI0018ECD9A1|nr:FecR domain-containing protein [Hymenobacter sp. BT559]MBJ6143202.1 FecR domain-containing protein [Hymenobacter sp. BT559]